MNWRWRLCALHGLRCFNQQGWQFFIPIALAFTFPGTLLPAVAVQTSQTFGRLFLAPRVALWYAKQASPQIAYLKILVADLFAVTSFGALLVCITTHLLQRQEQFVLRIALVLGGILSAIHASMNIVLGLVASKTWTAGLAQDASELAKANSMVTICELVVATIAPFAISSVLSSFDHATTTCILIIYQLISAAGILILSYSLAKKLTSLGRRVSTQSDSRDSPQDKESLSFESIIMKWLELPREVRGAMLAIVVLFCTVLGGANAGLIAWFALQGVSVDRMAAWTSSMNFVGFIGASVSPFVIRAFGPLRAAQAGQAWQMCFVLGGLVAFLTSNTTFFMIVIPLSRVGLWCFDLAERQMIQIAVPKHLLAPLFAAEASAQQCSYLSVLLLSVAFPQPSQFVIMVVISCSVTVLAGIILNIGALCKSEGARLDSANLLSSQDVQMERSHSDVAFVQHSFTED